jgi:hypothetical protein
VKRASNWELLYDYECDHTNDCNCGKTFRGAWDLRRHVESFYHVKHKEWLKDHFVYDQIDFETCLENRITKERIDKMRVGNTSSLYWLCFEAECACPHFWYAPDQ